MSSSIHKIVSMIYSLMNKSRFLFRLQRIICSPLVAVNRFTNFSLFLLSIRAFVDLSFLQWKIDFQFCCHYYNTNQIPMIPVFYFHDFVCYSLPEFHFRHLKFHRYLHKVERRNHHVVSDLDYIFVFLERAKRDSSFIFLYNTTRTSHFWSFWKLINNHVTAQILPVNYSGFTSICP